MPPHPLITWQAFLIVLSLSTLSLVLVYTLRCLIRYVDEEYYTNEDMWTADRYDFLGGIALFILVALTGIISFHSMRPRNVVLISDSPELLSSNLPYYVTPVMKWKNPIVERKSEAIEHFPNLSTKKLQTPGLSHLSPKSVPVEDNSGEVFAKTDPYSVFHYQ